MSKLKCLRCNYEWEKRGKDLPKECPRCKRYDWNKISSLNELCKKT